MTYKLNSMIQAEKVTHLLHLVKTNWSELPYWFTNEYEQGKATIGINGIYFSNFGSELNTEYAQKGNYLVFHSGQLHSIPSLEFEKLYSIETEFKLFTKEEVVKLLNLLIENPGVIHDAITNEHTEVDGEELFDTAINLLTVYP